MLRTNLSREFFVSPEVYRDETERIFARDWVCVGRIEEFPAAPSYRVVAIGPFSVVVTRPEPEAVHAFHNVCRHRGARVCCEPEGPLRNASVTCPYHAWTYDATGRLLGAPNMQDQAAFDRAEFPLLPVAARCWNGFVMLSLRADAGFDADYAPLVERLANWTEGGLRLVDTLRYTVRCNWKLLFQNYNECYHCPTVHPALNRLTPYRTATNDLTSGPFLGGPMELDAGFQTVSSDGMRVSQVFPGLSEPQRTRVYYYTVFPTMFLSAHPDYLMAHVLQRVSASETSVACHFLTTPADDDDDAPRPDLSRATQLWDEVNRQDWEMCELTQLGAESPAFRPGPYSKLEPMVYAFDQHYRAVMSESVDPEHVPPPCK